MAFKQSFAFWCFRDRGVDPARLLAAAAEVGYAGVDLIDEPLWPVVREHGLAIAAVGGHGTLTDGLNRAANAARIEAELRTSLAKAVQWRIPVLICFSGNRAGIDDEAGLAACAKTLARIAPEAESARVTLAVELLNSKVDHADYQCDRSDWGVRLCERVGSPAVKLLYDVYHMQIMEGDVIRSIRAHHAHFAHYHTAGVPGRHELNEDQELNYPAIFRAIKATGYTGYVGHEFIPQGEPVAALRRAYLDTQEAVAG